MVNDYPASRGLPAPSFDLTGPDHLLPLDTPLEISLACRVVIDDCLELRNFLLGPRERVMAIGYQATSLVSSKATAKTRLVHAFLSTLLPHSPAWPLHAD